LFSTTWNQPHSEIIVAQWSTVSQILMGEGLNLPPNTRACGRWKDQTELFPLRQSYSLSAKERWYVASLYRL
jgi:hypothetical protein